MSQASVIVAYERVNKLGELFVEKGAVSPETAKTLTELGFEKKSGVFRLMVWENHIIEMDGKYYLDVKKFNDEDVRTLHNLVAEVFDDVTI